MGPKLAVSLGMIAVLTTPAIQSADLREQFNELFQQGKYREAEELLSAEPAASDPAAVRILTALRDFRREHPDKEVGTIIVNPTDLPVVYHVRWGKGKWKRIALVPFSTGMRHRYPANRSMEPLDGNLQVYLEQPHSELPSKVYTLRSDLAAKGTLGGSIYYLAPTRPESERTELEIRPFSSFSSRSAALRIQNDTKNTIKYKWQEGPLDWGELTLKPGSSRVHEWPYYPGVEVPPAFTVQFVTLSDSGEYVPKSYTLPRNSGERSEQQSQAVTYSFRFDARAVLDLHKIVPSR